jgi:hypothetical protein
MDLVKLVYSHGSYDYKEATSRAMELIGIFLSSNVGCSGSSFKEFGLNAHEQHTSGNTIYLEKKNNYILLSDLYDQEKNPTKVNISIQHYIHLLDVWEKQVCKDRPKYVTIKRENNQFFIESQDQH